MSVWVNEQTCPMCSAPLTVSGGVSMEKTASRGAAESNLYYAASSHRRDHFSSIPSSDGLSGIGLACARAAKAGAAAAWESVLMAARVMHGRARPRRGFPGQARSARIPAVSASSAAACVAVPDPSNGPDQLSPNSSACRSLSHTERALRRR